MRFTTNRASKNLKLPFMSNHNSLHVNYWMEISGIYGHRESEQCYNVNHLIVLALGSFDDIAALASSSCLNKFRMLIALITVDRFLQAERLHWAHHNCCLRWAIGVLVAVISAKRAQNKSPIAIELIFSFDCDRSSRFLSLDTLWRSAARELRLQLARLQLVVVNLNWSQFGFYFKWKMPKRTHFGVKASKQIGRKCVKMFIV